MNLVPGQEQNPRPREWHADTGGRGGQDELGRLGHETTTTRGAASDRGLLLKAQGAQPVAPKRPKRLGCEGEGGGSEEGTYVYRR